MAHTMKKALSCDAQVASFFSWTGGYNIATVKMQCKEVASRSRRELRPDRDACRVDEFLEMALEELGSSICGSLEKHHSEQAQLLAESKLQFALMTKRQDQLERQKEELLGLQRYLKENLDRLKRESREEREKFLKEMITFNNEFNLISNRNAVFHTQTLSKIQGLELEAETLHKEMDLLKQKNTLLSSMEAERRSLEAELQDIQSQLTDIERDLKEAVALTESLKTERLMVRQKPLTDSTCIRLKKELELYKEEELELLRETLSSEIRSLQLKLSQKGILC